MTVQISVTIWTVICFIALYFILKYLLFIPVLDVMDKRQKKIDKAKSKAEEAKRLAEEKRAAFEKEKQMLLLDEQKKAEEDLRRIRQEGKLRLDKARKDRIAIIDAFRKKEEAKYEKDMQNIDRRMDDIADAFVSHIQAD